MATNSATDSDEAAHWAIRLENGPLEPSEQREFDEWLAVDERRHGALLRAEAILAHLDRGRALGEPSHDSYNDDERMPWTRRAFLAGGGSLAGLVAIGMTGFLLTRPKPIEIRTALGEIRRVPLPDGSIASVNTMSDIAAIMADTRREVKLRGGEAWFQVAHDKNRPFIVEAGPVRVKAVGTAFSVRRRESGADVLVTEGVVETWVVGREHARTRIAAGSRSFVADDAERVEVEPAADSIDRSLSWRTGELALNGESLEYAVDELNRYNARKIVIDSPDLGREPVVGYFRVDQLEGFARAISVTMGANVRSSTDEIHLSR